jgi:hypothetical protein
MGQLENISCWILIVYHVDYFGQLFYGYNIFGKLKITKQDTADKKTNNVLSRLYEKIILIPTKV